MTIRAIYENGVLRPLKPIRDIREGTEVEVSVTEAKEKKPQPTPDEVRASFMEIANLPLQPGPYFTGEDHDHILYGKPKK